MTEWGTSHIRFCITLEPLSTGSAYWFNQDSAYEFCLQVQNEMYVFYMLIILFTSNILTSKRTFLSFRQLFWYDNNSGSPVMDGNAVTKFEHKIWFYQKEPHKVFDKMIDCSKYPKHFLDRVIMIWELEIDKFPVAVILEATCNKSFRHVTQIWWCLTQNGPCFLDALKNRFSGIPCEKIDPQ